MFFGKVKAWRWLFLAIGIASVMVAGSYLNFVPQFSTALAVTVGQKLPITAFTQIGPNRIELEVAQTPEQQEMGLMHRTELAANRGMLFPFRPPRPVSFWMKNCRIALDMVFIRQEKVVGIAENAPPCRQDPCPTYDSRTSVDYVLELAAGRAKSLGLKPGDTVVIQPLTHP
jgi:uncharacterized membrane protein (UPF0127 family)